jgi:hypothetical protein
MWGNVGLWAQACEQALRRYVKADAADIDDFLQRLHQVNRRSASGLDDAQAIESHVIDAMPKTPKLPSPGTLPSKQSINILCSDAQRQEYVTGSRIALLNEPNG